MAALYIGLSVFFALLIAHFLKLSEYKGLQILPVLIVNYVVASTIAVISNISSGMDIIPQFPLFIWALAIFVGVLFILNFFIYSRSIHYNGVGTSVTAMRMSLLIPILLSIVWYSEELTIFRFLGIILVFLALFLLVRSRVGLESSQNAKYLLLILLFLFTGISEAALKVFQMEGMGESTEAHFMFVVFGTAMVTGIIMALKSGVRSVSKEEIGMGFLVGIPNLFTSIYLIKALQVADGTLVYSSVNVLIVIGGALLGFVYWKDKISAMQLAGMGIAVIAILLVM